MKGARHRCGCEPQELGARDSLRPGTARREGAEKRGTARGQACPGGLSWGSLIHQGPELDQRVGVDPGFSCGP